MNPFWLMARVAGVAFIAAAGVNVLIKQLAPKSSDLVAGTIHFRKGIEEIQKGFSTILFGTEEASPEHAKEAREARRIVIE
jgi:hypothetical protein